MSLLTCMPRSGNEQTTPISGRAQLFGPAAGCIERRSKNPKTVVARFRLYWIVNMIRSGRRTAARLFAFESTERWTTRNRKMQDIAVMRSCGIFSDRLDPIACCGSATVAQRQVSTHDLDCLLCAAKLRQREAGCSPGALWMAT
jgi:hypothetical protein